MLSFVLRCDDEEPLLGICKLAEVNFTIARKLPRTKSASQTAVQGGQNFLHETKTMLQYFVELWKMNIYIELWKIKICVRTTTSTHATKK